jgi:hypothetical protein
MFRPVASVAQGNEIRIRIISRMAAFFSVMYLQVATTSAGLAGPIISAQDFLSELVVLLGLKPNAPALWKTRHRQCLGIEVVVRAASIENND